MGNIHHKLFSRQTLEITKCASEFAYGLWFEHFDWAFDSIRDGFDGYDMCQVLHFKSMSRWFVENDVGDKIFTELVHYNELIVVAFIFHEIISVVIMATATFIIRMVKSLHWPISGFMVAHVIQMIQRCHKTLVE